MIDNTQLLDIVMNHKHYKSTRVTLSEYGTEFSVYSCDNDMVDKVHALSLKTDKAELDELVAFIKEANGLEMNIHDLMFNKIKNQAKKNELDQFFEAFEDVDTAERLFILMGETGVGKSWIVEHKYPDIISVPATKAIDPYSLMFSLEDKGEGLRPYPTPFHNAIVEGLPTWVDEGNEFPLDTRMFVQNLTDEKKRIMVGSEMITIKKGFKIIMTLNPPSETDEREPLGDALLGRAVGLVMELTDELMIERLQVSMSWVNTVRKIYGHIRQSGMIDMRDLNFRDYQRFAKYNFETQLKFKVCMGDVTNIKEYRKIQETGEYAQLIEKVLKAR